MIAANKIPLNVIVAFSGEVCLLPYTEELLVTTVSPACEVQQGTCKCTSFVHVVM